VLAGRLRLIETAKLNMHESHDYLRWLFTELPKMNGGDVEGLMRWSVEPPVIMQG